MLDDMYDDTERCARAVRSRDPRFDGWFFAAVRSTGIYCRPSCPAVVPRPENLRFYPSAAAAQQAGFRACKRCRPDASPGSPLWDVRADVVARAMRLIADGVVDRDGVPGLATQLGYSTRQVQRQLLAELGAGPLALARAQRAQTARILIETSDLPMGDVAFAAGFTSVRAFNDTVREIFALSPTELRHRARHPGAQSGRTSRPAVSARLGSPPGPAGIGPAGILSLRLPFRAPLCPDNLFGHLVATAVPGVEEWREGAFRRTLRLPHGPAAVALRPRPDHVACELTLADLRDLSTAISRCRRLLDLDADPIAVDAHLAEDPTLAAPIHAAPGRRVPRTVDPAEFAVRAVLGQQVSTAAARTHARRLVEALGERVEGLAGGLTHLFPAPPALAGGLATLSDTELALPRARRAALTGLARALADGAIDLGTGADWRQTRAALAALPGLGPWTVESIAMRALGDPDAFLPTDLGVQRAAARLGLPTTPRALAAHSAAWRPWRSYAVQYLWATGDHPINRLPPHRAQSEAPGTAMKAATL
nr:DNA-3-methyladenine glycosylase 2 family protein [Frankia sp. AiPa1]